MGAITHATQTMLQRLLELATEHGYASLFFIAFIDGAGLPVPAELTLLAVVTLIQSGDVPFWPAVLLGGAANTAGSLIPYGLGRWTAGRLVERWLPEEPARRERLRVLLSSYAVLALILTRLIGFVRVAVVAMSGILRLPLVMVVPAIYLGSIIWLYTGFHVIGLIGLETGALMEGLVERSVDIVLAAAVLVAAVVFYRRYRRRNRAVGGA